MNDKITIQRVTESRSSMGAVTETWATFTTAWVEVEQVSGNENFNSDMMVYSDIKQFKGYYSELKDVTPKMRIVYRGENYQITAKFNIDRLRTSLTAVRHDDE